MAGKFDERLCKKIPDAFYGGQTSITHMHFDIDLSHIFIHSLWAEKECYYFPMKNSINYIVNHLKY